MSSQDRQRLCHALPMGEQAGHKTHLKQSNFCIAFPLCLLYLNMLALDTFIWEHISMQHGRQRSGSPRINLQRELLSQMSLHWVPQHAQAQCQKPDWKGICCGYSWNFCLGWQNPKCADPGHEMTKQIPFHGKFPLASWYLPWVSWQYKFPWQQPK